MYGLGISKVGEIVDLGVEHGILQKSGSWFAYDTTKLGQGREAVKELLLDNPELMAEVEAKIRARIKNNMLPMEKPEPAELE
jgi:recombination protein RecA